METDTTRKPGLRSRLARALKPKSSIRRLQRKSIDETSTRKTSVQLSSSNNSNLTRPPTNEAPPSLDIQTGERRDDTEMLHSLAHHHSYDSLVALKNPIWRTESVPGKEFLGKLPKGIWDQIIGCLPLSAIASLGLSCKDFRNQIGMELWNVLRQPENQDENIAFLVFLDSVLPDHLLCFPCGIYHRRTQKGQERLRAAHIINPLFSCPLALEPTEMPIRMRIAPGHKLPFAFVQLVLRAIHNTPDHGIPLNSLGRRWKDKNSDWYTQTSYYYHKRHLLFRSVSKSFAAPSLPPSAVRNLLYSREDYTPYFSTCAHWRDGVLMNLCKCALSHIPQPRESITHQLKSGPQLSLALRNVNPIVTLCKNCRPMRRCPECPTEHLIEIRFEEDKNETHPLKRFKQAIVVTRWSDLGDGSTPMSPEWAACNGCMEYDSFANIGHRGISGTFESQSGVAIPGQRMLSMNPNNEKLGEEGHSWY